QHRKAGLALARWVREYRERPDVANVVGGEDGDDAGYPTRAVGVHVRDQRMSVRATQQRHVQRTLQHQVRHVRAPPRATPQIPLPQEPPADQALAPGDDYD